MFVGFSTKIFHSFHEGKNGSLTVSEKAEQAHYSSRKFWFHGTQESLRWTQLQIKMIWAHSQNINFFK